MSKQLVIVESPAKANTIAGFLGEEYTVLSSYGHVRDLPSKEMAIDTQNQFQPQYIIPDNKQPQIGKLKKAAQTADTVWLATDEDREGEAIAWHLMQVLELSEQSTKRITFHEITPQAITEAMQNPRSIDQNLVDTQQARRVLDRLVGYEISPLLWRKVQPGLSAGRVQSVAVRLIVEREREIEDFEPESTFKISATFSTDSGEELPAELAETVRDASTARQLLESMSQAQFTVGDVTEKPGTRNPAAPFTTSTLQQVASRKLGYSVKQTMTLAQRLYEAGHITYMRTDSVTLSGNALGQIKRVVEQTFGAEYHQYRSYKSRSDAQEAHEAIRPTDVAAQSVSGDKGEQRLYELIRGRTLASQMAAATLNKTTITIQSPSLSNPFKAKGEVITFPGWLKAHQDTAITDIVLPTVEAGEALTRNSVQARQTFKRPPTRYSEAALVRKLEAMGIGRPSTYAPTISTIQDRGYVEKGNTPGSKRDVVTLSLDSGGDVTEAEETIMYGQDKNKLFPTQIALLVNDFLTKQFDDIVDYDFTKEVEEAFDRIARGKEAWNRMIADFYGPFHEKVEAAESLSREQASGARELGTDPDTGRPVIARMGKYGPMLQLGRPEDEQKPKFAPIPSGEKIHSITFEEALRLLQLPRYVGAEEDGSEIYANYGRYGPYVKSGDTFAAIPEGDDPFSVSQTTARTALTQQREQKAKRTIADLGGIKVLNGRFGPYVTNGSKNAKIPKDITPQDLDQAQAQQILDNAKTKSKTSKKSGSASRSKSPSKPNQGTESKK
ncbi:type I DNA topoisomerase [Candidatus Saccharibacteria bacterium SW_7_54_9]|nr:MAG: type I DNA topoisomerase [Candidatus Saccharibacteria bacterium SW_7_54_9]